MSKKVLSDLDFNGAARGVNHPDPVNPQDVATKAYVDSGTGTVPANAVDNTKLADMASPRLKGRTTAAAGDPEDLTLVNSNTSSWNTASGGSISVERAALTGDVTAAANSNTTAIAANAVTTAKVADDAVTNAKAANVPSPSLKGRTTATTGDPEDLTLANSTSASWNTATGGALSVERAALTGDVTAAANANTTTIANNAVSNAKAADVPSPSLKGRTTAATGDPEDLTLVGSTTNTWNTATAGSISLERAALTGDVTASANSNATTIATNAVTTAKVANDAIDNTKLANMASPRIKGRTTATTGDPEDLTPVNSTTNTWNTATGGSISVERAALTGDVTASANSNATTIANDAVTNAKLGNMAPGRVKGLQVDGVLGDPQDLTGTEVGQLVRHDTVITDTTSSGTIATFAIASTTTQVQFKLAANITINGMTATSATFGKTVMFSFDQGFAGSVTWNNESASAGGTLERVRTPDGFPLTITAGQSVVMSMFDSRWRVISVAKGASVADRDYGDVVVAGSGLTWSIDNDVVTNAKAANVPSPSLKGRTTATTGDPEDLTLVNSTSNSWNTATGGSVSLERAALTGDVTAGQNANTTAFRQLAATSVLANATSSSAVPTDLTASTNDTVLRRNSVGVLDFGRIRPAMFDALSDVPLSAVADLSALSVVAQPTTTPQAPTVVAATAGSDAVLRESGSTLGFGAIATGGIANDAVTNAKLVNVNPGTVKGLQVNASGSADPVDLVGTEVGELLRIDTRVDDASTSGTGAPYSVAAQTNWVRFTALTGAYTLEGCDATASGKLIIWHVEPGVTGTLVLNHNSAAVTNALRFFCPGAANLTLGAGDTAVTVFTSNRHRVVAVARGGALSGDITKAAGSDVTAIAAGVIVDADVNAAAAIALSKLATQAANTIVANATASTAVPTAVAVGTNTVLGRVAGNVVAAQLVDAQITNATISLPKVATQAANTVVANATASSASPTAVAVGTNTVLGRVGANIVAAQAVNAQIAGGALSTVKGVALSGVAGTLQDLTGAQIAELLRWGTTQDTVLSGGSTADLSLGASTTVLRLATADGFHLLTGVTGGAQGRLLLVMNVSADGNTVALANEVASTTANQFITPNSNDYTLPARSTTLLFWDSTKGKWSVFDRASSLTDIQPIAANTIAANATASVATPSTLSVGTNTVVGRVAGNLVAAQLVDAQITNATISLPKVATQAANTVVANATASSASPTAVSIGTNTVLGRVGANIVAAQAVNAQITGGAVGSVKGVAVGGVAGTLQDLTGPQLGEAVRRITTVVDSTSTGSIATFALAATTTQVRFTGSGTATIHGISSAASLWGQTVEFHVETGVAGSLVFMHESGSAGAAGERLRTPGGQTLTLLANESVSATYYDNRWRLTGTAKVTSTADIRNDAVDNTKLANVPSPSLKGRTTAASGDPEDLTLVNSTTNTWNTSTGGAISVESAALTGVVTTSANSTATAFGIATQGTFVANPYPVSIERSDHALSTLAGTALTTESAALTGDAPTLVEVTPWPALFTTSTSFPVTLPSNRRVGDRVVYWIYGQSLAALVLPSGFVVLQGPTGTYITGSNQSMFVEKIIDGTETDVQTFTRATSQTVGFMPFIVRGSDTTRAAVGNISASGSTVTTYNPANVTTGWGSVNALCLSVVHAITATTITFPAELTFTKATAIIAGEGFGTFRGTFSSIDLSAYTFATASTYMAAVLVFPPLPRTRLAVANDAVDNTKLANMAMARIKGVPYGAADPSDPQDLTGSQVGEILRLGLAQDVLLAQASSPYNDYALDQRTKTIRVFVNPGETVTITGFALGSSNSGGAFTVWKWGNGTLVFAHANSGSIGGNQLQLPYGRDLTLQSLEGIDFQYIGGRWQGVTKTAIGRVRKNSTGTEFVRGRLNLIESTNVAITVADDSTNDEIDTTLDLVAVPAGTVKGAQIDAGGSIVPVNLTGAEVGELIRYGTTQSVSFSAALNDQTLNADATVLQLNPTGNQTFSGMTGGVNGRVVIIENTASTGVAGVGNVVTLLNQDAGSIAANRFRNPQAAPVVLGFRESAIARWDSGNSDWRIISKTTRYGEYYAPAAITPATLNDYAVSGNVQVLFIDVNGAGDVIFTGFAHGSTNAGARFLLVKTGADGRIILKDNQGSATVNRIWTPGSVDYVLTGYNDSVALVHNGFTWFLESNQVANARMAPMSAATVKGRALGAGTGDPQDLTAAQVNAIVGSTALTLGQLILGNQQTEAGALPLNITLGATTSYLLITSTGDGEIQTISGAATGRVVVVDIWNFGTKTVKHSSGSSSSLICPGLVDFKVGVRDSFLLVGESGGWIVMPVSPGAMAEGTAKGRARGAGSGLATELTGLQLGALLRLDNAIGDTTTTGTIATYTLAADKNNLTFNGVTNVIHGFTAAAEPGHLLFVSHIGTGTTTLVTESSTATSVNDRMVLGDGIAANTSAIVLGAAGVGGACNSVMLMYTGNRWKRMDNAHAVNSIPSSALAQSLVQTSSPTANTYHDVVINPTTRVYDVTPTGDVVITGFSVNGGGVAGNTGFGFYLVKNGFSGRVILANNTGSSAGNVIVNSNVVDLVLEHAVDGVYIQYVAGRAQWFTVQPKASKLRINSTGGWNTREKLNAIAGGSIALAISDNASERETNLTVAVSDGNKGDVTVSGSGATWGITAGAIVDADINASAAIALTKLNTQNQNTVLVNATAGSATPTALSLGTNSILGRQSSNIAALSLVNSATVDWNNGTPGSISLDVDQTANYSWTGTHTFSGWPVGYSASATLAARTTTTASISTITPLTFTIPANSAGTGACFLFHIHVHCGRTTTTTACGYTLEVKVGNTTRLSFGPIALATATNSAGSMILDGELTMLGAVGASAPIGIVGAVMHTLTSASPVSIAPIPSVAQSAATNGALALDITMAMNANVAGCSFTPLSGYIQRVR